MGTEKDDVTNTFTARLLLLLESRPLVEDAAYKDIVQEVIKSYWRDYDDHSATFMPAFLANDILRLWRTFCVNYEARTERKPEREKAKGKQTYVQSRTVTPEDAMVMVELTPTARLDWLRCANRKTDEIVQKLQDQYDRFLTTTNADEKSLLDRFANKDEAFRLSKDALMLGDLMFDALSEVGNVDGGRDFYRLLVV